MKSSLFFSVVIGALTVVPSLAFAQDQPWLKDRKYTEGIGYRVGDYELHPGAAAEFGYNSNFFHYTSDPPGSLALRITPSLSFSTLSQQRLESSAGDSRPAATFSGGLALTYNEFFGVGSNTQGVKWDAQRNVNGLLNLGLAINPGRAWSGTLAGSFARMITPNEGSIQTQALSYNRDIPQAAAEIAYAPGAGLFEWRLGYHLTGTIFESSQYSNASNLLNEVQTRGRWRFLPRTALVFDGRFGFLSYPTPATGAVAPGAVTPAFPEGAPAAKNGGHPVRALIGINGLVTNSFSLLAMGGWGASFYTPGRQQDFDSMIGQVELRWLLNPAPSEATAPPASNMSSIAVGFSRDFFDTLLGTYYERDRAYLSFSHMFAGKFLMVAEGGAGPMVFPKGANAIATYAGFTDVRLDASLFGEYRIQDAFGINATFRYNQEISNDASIPQGGANPPANLAFQQFESFLGVRWLM